MNDLSSKQRSHSNEMSIILVHAAWTKTIDRSSLWVIVNVLSSGCAAWRSGSELVTINEVSLRRTRLILGWATSLTPVTSVSLISNLGQLSLLPSTGRQRVPALKGGDALWQVGLGLWLILLVDKHVEHERQVKLGWRHVTDIPHWAQWRFWHAKSGGHVGANEKVGARLETYLRSIFGLSITIVYVSLQEWQNIHKTMFTTILLSYSAAFGLCIKDTVHSSCSV